MAKWILHSKDRTLDHACAECIPDGALVVPGFRCGYHTALHTLSAADDAGRPDPEYAPVQAVVDQFVADYQLHGELGSHTPTARERGLIANAVAGLLADTVFLREFDKWRRADSPQASPPLEAAVSVPDRAGAGDLATLRNTLAAVRVVGQIDGHDVIRRLSMLDLVDRERCAAEGEARAHTIALADAHEKGVMDALRGVHELFVHEAGCAALPPDSPLQDGDKPFCRFTWYSDSGDAHVGIPWRSYWALDDNQTGTVLGELIASLSGPPHAAETCAQAVAAATEQA